MHEQVIVGEAIAGRAAKVRRQLFDLSADVKASTLIQSKGGSQVIVKETPEEIFAMLGENNE